jgi:osmotically-inducible protein OsmY
VISENGTVYLMGAVTQEQSDAAVAVAQRAFGVQKIVKVFEYTDSYQ